jgi:phage shock protein E
MSRLALVILLGLAAVAAQAQSGSKQPVAAAPSAATAAQTLYVDVRTPQEFAGGHIAGALNIPLEQLESRWKELLPARDKPVVLYCRSGRRSQLALDMLTPRGFSRLQNGGGLDQLARSGLATAR